VCVIAIGVFFPIYINTRSGVRNLDQDLILAAKSLGAKGVSIVRKVIIPGSLPYFFSSLRLAIGIALILLVTSEMIASNSGIGHMILRAADLMMTDRLIAGIVVLSALGLALSYIVGAVEKIFHARQN
jgi:NitT/TauT family transport system permease protein